MAVKPLYAITRVTELAELKPVVMCDILPAFLTLP